MYDWIQRRPQMQGGGWMSACYDRCTVETGGVAPNLPPILCRLSNDWFMHSTKPSPIEWYGVGWDFVTWKALQRSTSMLLSKFR